MKVNEDICKILKISRNLSRDIINEYFTEIEPNDFFKLAEITSLGISLNELENLNQNISRYLMNSFNNDTNRGISVWQLLVSMNTLNHYSDWAPKNSIKKFLLLCTNLNVGNTKFIEKIQDFIHKRLKKWRSRWKWKNNVISIVKGLPNLPHDVQPEIIGWIIVNYKFISNSICKKLLEDSVNIRMYKIIPYLAAKVPIETASFLLSILDQTLEQRGLFENYLFLTIQVLERTKKKKELKLFLKFLIHNLFKKHENIIFNYERRSLLSYCITKDNPCSEYCWNELIKYIENNVFLTEEILKLLDLLIIQYRYKPQNVESFYKLLLKKESENNKYIIKKFLILSIIALENEELKGNLKEWVDKNQDRICKTIQTQDPEIKINLYGCFSVFGFCFNKFQRELDNLLSIDVKKTNACISNYLNFPRFVNEVIKEKEVCLKFFRFDKNIPDFQERGKKGGMLLIVTTKDDHLPKLYRWDDKSYGNPISTPILGIKLIEKLSTDEIEKLTSWFNDTNKYPLLYYVREKLKEIPFNEHTVNEFQVTSSDEIEELPAKQSLEEIIQYYLMNNRNVFGFINLYNRVESYFPWDEVLPRILHYTDRIIMVFTELIRRSIHLFSPEKVLKFKEFFSNFYERINNDLTPRGELENNRYLTLAQFYAALRNYNHSIGYFNQYINNLDFYNLKERSISELYSPLFTKIYYLLIAWECFFHRINQLEQLNQSEKQELIKMIQRDFNRFIKNMTFLENQCQNFNPSLKDKFNFRTKILEFNKNELEIKFSTSNTITKDELFIKLADKIKKYYNKLEEKLINNKKSENTTFFLSDLELDRFKSISLKQIFNARLTHPELWERVSKRITRKRNPFLENIQNNEDLGIIYFNSPFASPIIPKIKIEYDILNENKVEILISSDFELYENDNYLVSQFTNPPWIQIKSTGEKLKTETGYKYKIHLLFPKDTQNGVFFLKVAPKGEFEYFNPIIVSKNVKLKKKIDYKKRDPNKIRWLHISDLHIRNKNSSDPIFLQILSYLKNQINYIFLTGDIVFSGKKNEYKVGKSFLRKLLKVINTKSLFLVPGNHDLNWNYKKSSEEMNNITLIEEIKLYKAQKSLEKLSLLRCISNQQKSFHEFWLDIIRKYMNSENFKVFELNYWEYKDKFVEVFGLNSALGANSEVNSKHWQFISQTQIEDLFETRNCSSNFIKLCFILTHFPFTIKSYDVDQKQFIRNEDRDEILEKIKNYNTPCIICSGHTHDPSYFSLYGKLEEAGRPPIFYSQSGEVPMRGRYNLVLNLGEYNYLKKLIKVYQIRLLRSTKLDFEIEPFSYIVK